MENVKKEKSSKDNDYELKIQDYESRIQDLEVLFLLLLLAKNLFEVNKTSTKTGHYLPRE